MFKKWDEVTNPKFGKGVVLGTQEISITGKSGIAVRVSFDIGTITVWAHDLTLLGESNA